MSGSPSPKLFSANLLVLTAAVAIVGSNSLLLSPILSDVAQALSTAPTTIARAVSFNGGGTALSAFLLGPWIDRLGARRALLLGISLLLAGTLASAAAVHWAMLAAAQAVAGAGSGLVLPSSYALATSLAPRGLEARALGRVLTGWSISLVAGVPASAFLTDAIDWRAPYLAVAILCAAIGFCSLHLPRARTATVRSAFNPLAPMAIPGVGVLLLICLGFMSAFYGVYAFVGDHVRMLHHWSAAQAATLVLAYGIGFGLATFGDGLVDRFGAARLFPVVLAVDVVLYAVMPNVAESQPGIVVFCSIWGFTNHFALNILVLLLSQVGARARGAVLALNSAVTYVGVMVGVETAAALYARFGFSQVAMAAAAMLVVATGLAWVRRSAAVLDAPAG